MRKNNSIEHARAMREARAQFVEDLRLGTTTLREVLSDYRTVPPGLDIWEVLLATPRLGPETSRRVCERAGVWPHLKVCTLTKSQIRRVIDELPERIK